MASRRESRSAATGLNTLQEFENLRKAFKASNDKLAKKNNELLAQISSLNKQLQESLEENFYLRGENATLQRNAQIYQARAAAFQQERQTMLDLMDEINRASEWTRKNLSSLRRSFDAVDNPPGPSKPSSEPKSARPRQSVATIMGVSRAPDISRISEGGSDIFASPQPSPQPPKVNPRSPSRLMAHPTSAQVPKARDSLSIPLESTPVPSSSKSISSRKGGRRPSGLISPLDPTATFRPSPPPFTPSPDAEQGYASTVQVSRGVTDDLDHHLPPISIPTISNVSVSHRLKDQERNKKRPLSSASESEPPTIDVERGNSGKLYDVTNASGTVKKDKTVLKLQNHIASSTANTSISKDLPPPTPITERKPKKLHVPAPSLSEDFMRHGDLAVPLKTPKVSTSTSSSSHIPLTSTRPRERSSSPLEPPPKSSSDVEPSGTDDIAGGRSTRVRKSVNYAEPKLNTKMRKPEGWDEAQKTRKSFLNTPAQSGSSSPPRPEESITKKRRSTATTASTSLHPPSSRHRSSSPLGDVDEPKPSSTRSTGSAMKRRLIDDAEEDGDDERLDPLGEGRATIWEASTYTTKPSSKGKSRASPTEPTIQDTAPSTVTARRPKSAYSSTVLMSDSEDDQDDSDDDYIDGADARPSTAKSSSRRPSGLVTNRPTVNGQYSSTG